jgi:hypothetical protein
MRSPGAHFCARNAIGIALLAASIVGVSVGCISAISREHRNAQYTRRESRRQKQRAPGRTMAARRSIAISTIANASAIDGRQRLQPPPVDPTSPDSHHGLLSWNMFRIC